MIKFLIITVLAMSHGAFCNAADGTLGPDGKLRFQKSKVNGKICHSQKEENDAKAVFDVFKSTSDAAIVEDVSPSEFEVSLSTVGQFHVYQDFLNAKTKTGLIDQATRLYQRIQVLKDVGDKDELSDLQQRYNWLISEAKKLP